MGWRVFFFLRLDPNYAPLKHNWQCAHVVKLRGEVALRRVCISINIWPLNLAFQILLLIKKKHIINQTSNSLTLHKYVFGGILLQVEPYAENILRVAIFSMLELRSKWSKIFISTSAYLHCACSHAVIVYFYNCHPLYKLWALVSRYTNIEISN